METEATATPQLTSSAKTALHSNGSPPMSPSSMMRLSEEGHVDAI